MCADLNRFPKIGLGVLIFREGKILLGKRKNSHGAESWQAPGGHLEFGETIEDCARREVLEETGLTISDLKQGPYTNDFFRGADQAQDKHYVTLFILAQSLQGTPEVREPEKCESWKWFEWDNLPEPLFLPLANLLRSGFKTNHASLG